MTGAGTNDGREFTAFVEIEGCRIVLACVYPHAVEGSAGTQGMDVPERDIAQAAAFIAPPGYRRHRPEATLLYQLVAEHYPRFRDRRATEERPLPRYVEGEFEAYLKCGLLEHGFLRVKCESCKAEKLVAFSCKRRGLLPELRGPADDRRVQGCTS